ncbi:MAG: Ig-like domain-containing protein [Paludibacter sp.]|nr:Ig-like domain-containing protein [Paludibacter sp.]
MQKITIIGLISIILFFQIINAQTDLSIQTYGPSQGRIPASYAEQIQNNLDNLNYVKFYANKAIEYFLDDDCPLPKNLVGDFKDENGNDAASMYRANEGCASLMLALYNLYLTYPNDSECQDYLQRVIRFANCILEYGTDRYGPVHTPQLASILMRTSTPYVPFDPENPDKGVRIEERTVWSYTDNAYVYNYCAIGVGNIWYDSDESQKASWRGTDVEANNDLYSLLYKLSSTLDINIYTDKNKYKKAADASLSYWLNNCQTESHMFPWGEHSGWNFFEEKYNDDYYHAPLHEYKGNFRLNLDKLIENQARVRPGEMTTFEKYASGLKAVHTATADKGRRYNGYILEGMFLFGRHGPLWTDRITARYQENNQDIGGSFGCFPKHIGSYLYIMSFAYNRSHDEKIRDSLATNLNFFLDGLEAQKLVYTGGKYYPYGTFNWYGYPTGEISSNQNSSLGTFAKRASAFMDGLNDNITQKLLTVAENTSIATNYSYTPYPGPDLVSITAPQDGYVVYKSLSVNLKWSSSEGAVAYRIYFSENMNAVSLATTDSTAFINETSKPEYVIGNLASGKTYYWAIDAINENGDITKGYIMKFSTSEDTPTLLQSIVLEPKELQIENYASDTLVPQFYPQNASNQYVEWKSSDTSIVSVDKMGKITAVQPGTAIIKATSVDQEDVYGTCSVTVNQLSQQISWDEIPTKYLPDDEYIDMNATSSSLLPISYQVISGPATLQEKNNILPTNSSYINGSTLTYQNLLRLKVNGMNVLFKINLSNIDKTKIDHVLFEYTTVLDGHRRNYDVQVNMIEYPNSWNPGESAPDPVSITPVSNTITQSKIGLQSTFDSYDEYLAAYQQPIRLDITDFVKNKLAEGQYQFCIGLQATKSVDTDGEDYIRIASQTYSDESCRPSLIIYHAGDGGSMQLTGTGSVSIKATQAGNSIYLPATNVQQTFEVRDTESSTNTISQSGLIQLFPNPIKKQNLHIIVKDENVCKIEMYKMTSELIFSKSIHGEKDILVNPSLFQPGMYIISVTTNNGSFNYKLIAE